MVNLSATAILLLYIDLPLATARLPLQHPIRHCSATSACTAAPALQHIRLLQHRSPIRQILQHDLSTCIPPLYVFCCNTFPTPDLSTVATRPIWQPHPFAFVATPLAPTCIRLAVNIAPYCNTLYLVSFCNILYSPR